MAYNPGPGYPPSAPGQGAYPPYPGYPAPGGPGMQPDNMGFQAPPPGYAYPPPAQPFPPGGDYSYGHPQPPPGYHQPGGHYGGPPIMEQPMGGQGQFIGGHSVPINVPSGLEQLAMVDRVFMKQKVELLEAFLGCETKNKYKIKNAQGQLMFDAKEDTDCCTRNCCGSLRPFDIKIKDQSEREVIHLSRPFACGSCLCPCLLQSIEVFAPPGQLAGTVEQQWSLCSPEFVIKNASGETVLRITGPACTFSLCGSVEFEILALDGSTPVGKISKQWSGLLREAFTDADNFGISFPMDLDVRMKAVMLGACFLIDFMFFEKSNNQENDLPGML